MLLVTFYTVGTHVSDRVTNCKRTVRPCCLTQLLRANWMYKIMITFNSKLESQPLRVTSKQFNDKAHAQLL